MTNSFFFGVSSVIVQKEKLITREGEGTFNFWVNVKKCDMTTNRPPTYILEPIRTLSNGLFPKLLTSHSQAVMHNI